MGFCTRTRDGKTSAFSPATAERFRDPDLKRNGRVASPLPKLGGELAFRFIVAGSAVLLQTTGNVPSLRSNPTTMKRFKAGLPTPGMQKTFHRRGIPATVKHTHDDETSAFFQPCESVAIRSKSSRVKKILNVLPSRVNSHVLTSWVFGNVSPWWVLAETHDDETTHDVRTFSSDLDFRQKPTTVKQTVKPITVKQK